jgi:type II secretory pathway pseudopilin PulG
MHPQTLIKGEVYRATDAARISGAIGRSQGFTVLDLLIAATIMSIVISYALTEIVHAQTAALRHRAAQEFSSYLERARNDSIRRHATDPRQMARIIILTRHSYSVALDANGDGVIDSPVMVNMAEQKVVLGDPAPRTLMFDWLGRTVDSSLNVIQEPSVTISNSSGTSLINVSDIARSVATQNFAVSSSRK